MAKEREKLKQKEKPIVKSPSNSINTPSGDKKTQKPAQKQVNKNTKNNKQQPPPPPKDMKYKINHTKDTLKKKASKHMDNVSERVEEVGERVGLIKKKKKKKTGCCG